MFISFSVKRFGPHFSFYLLFPEFSVLPLLARSPAPTPPHPPRSVKWQRADGYSLTFSEGWPWSPEGHPRLLSAPAEADGSACGPGLHSWDALSLSVWPNALSLLRWVQPIWWARETGTGPLSFSRAWDEGDKRPSFEGHSESVSCPKGKLGRRNLCLIKKRWGSLFWNLSSLSEGNDELLTEELSCKRLFLYPSLKLNKCWTT